jgi:hypothetical protein
VFEDAAAGPVVAGEDEFQALWHEGGVWKFETRNSNDE